MRNLIETLRSKWTGYGHFNISIEMDGKKLEATTTNTMAIDAAFDDCYDDDDNSGRYYESREEAQEALVNEILRANEIEIYMNWKRYRLKTYAVSDNRPLIFNPKYPWWCSGYGEDDKGEYSVIIAYLPKDEDLLKYWDDAFDVEFTEEEESISFSDRFPKPSYFVF